MIEDTDVAPCLCKWMKMSALLSAANRKVTVDCPEHGFVEFISGHDKVQTALSSMKENLKVIDDHAKETAKPLSSGYLKDLLSKPQHLSPGIFTLPSMYIGVYLVGVQDSLMKNFDTMEITDSEFVFVKDSVIIGSFSVNRIWGWHFEAEHKGSE